jgi:hypothetical protein
MNWPSPRDYNEAIRNPATNFADPELCGGQVVTDALGTPQRHAGSFADVYEVHCPATRNRWAVKCFTRPVVQGLHECYAAVSAYLEHIRLPFAEDCEYLEQGIRLPAGWFPVVKMRWVPGVPLNEFIRDALDRPALLEGLADVWVRLARRLRGAAVAHGDIQHANLLVTPGEYLMPPVLKLVDYDGMFVPALTGRQSGEVGHRNYQHPQRLRGYGYGPEMDRFGLLVVAAALRCLRVGGRALWDRYNTGDNLLFRAADFAAPHDSPLFAELLRLDDPQGRGLAARLMAAAQKPLEQTPSLDEVFSSRPPAAAPAPASPKAEGLIPTGAAASRGAEPPQTPPITWRDPGLKLKPVLPLIGAGFVCASLLVVALAYVGAPHEPSLHSPRADRNPRLSVPSRANHPAAGRWGDFSDPPADAAAKTNARNPWPAPEPDGPGWPTVPPGKGPGGEPDALGPPLPKPPANAKPAVPLPAEPAERRTPQPAPPPGPPPEDPKLDSNLAPHLAALKSPRVSERIAALERLGKKGDRARGAARAICDLFVTDPSTQVRQTALLTLEKVHPDLYRPAVVLAVDTDPAKQAAAALEVGELGADGQAAVPIVRAHLLAALGEMVHPHPVPQRPVTVAMVHNDLRALAAIAPGEAGVHRTLIEATKVEVPSSVRGTDALSSARQLAAQLLEDLVRAHPEQARSLAPALIASARIMPPFEARAQVAGILGLLAENHPELRPRIAAALTEMVLAEELMAIFALAKCGRDARAALPLLRQLKLHRLEAVRAAASETIALIEDAES